jgi:hypothetical protein
MTTFEPELWGLSEGQYVGAACFTGVFTLERGLLQSKLDSVMV